MPNWCQNSLSVTGADDLLDEFAAAVSGRDHDGCEQPLSLATFCPEPDAGEDRAVSDTALFKAMFGIDPDSPEMREHAGRVATLMQTLQSDNDVINWRLVHWGCKWDVLFDVSETGILLGAPEADPATAAPVIRVPGEISYRFLSPWSPPEPAIEILAKQWPALELRLRFAESGNDFAGEIIWREGERAGERNLEVDQVLSPEQRWF